MIKNLKIELIIFNSNIWILKSKYVFNVFLKKKFIYSNILSIIYQFKINRINEKIKLEHIILYINLII